MMVSRGSIEFMPKAFAIWARRFSPSTYLETLRDVFADDCDVSIIRHGSHDIAGVLSFYFRDEVLPYYGGSRPLARDLKANDFMYWDLMQRAVERGARTFDFGRSKIDTGPYNFKKNWGFEPTPLTYEFYLVTAKQVPRVDPTNPKYRQFIKMWKRLPLPIANSRGAISCAQSRLIQSDRHFD